MAAMARIRAAVESRPVVLFMKGTPQYPMCGHSARAADVLSQCDAPFHAVNVLADPEIRASLPRYSNWPTFPQLFIQGELIGVHPCRKALAMRQQSRRRQRRRHHLHLSAELDDGFTDLIDQGRITRIVKAIAIGADPIDAGDATQILDRARAQQGAPGVAAW